MMAEGEVAAMSQSEVAVMAENEAASVAKGLVLSGFQLKGSSKRRKISSDYDNKKEEREAVLEIEQGKIKSASGLSSDPLQLVIPLPPSRVDILRATKANKPENNNDKVIETKTDVEMGSKTLEQLAAEELIADLLGVKKPPAGSTLSIPTSDNNINRSKDAKAAPLLMASLAPELIGLTDDSERFKADIDMRPDDLHVRSDAYKSVPIDDFGAAMLRGMGWTGPSEEDAEREKAGKERIVPRDARLGLGALCRPPDEKNRGNREKNKVSKKEWEKKAEEKLKKQVLSEGDIVWLKDPSYAGRRGSVVAVRGVPGLDRIRVSLETSGKSVEIKRTDAVLLSESDLEAEPYRGLPPVMAEEPPSAPKFFGLQGTNKNIKKDDRKDDKKGKEKSSSKYDDRNGKTEKSSEYSSKESSSKYDDSSSKKRSYDDKRISHKDEDDHNQKRSHDKKGSYRDDDNHRKETSTTDRSRDATSKSSNSSSSNSSSSSSSNNSSSWLMTGIRVRIVSKKVDSSSSGSVSSYLQKGSVVDVPDRGIATIRFDDGRIIESVKEKYLETVLPSVGALCSVLGKLFSLHTSFSLSLSFCD
jgi:hypothetical protein